MAKISTIIILILILAIVLSIIFLVFYLKEKIENFSLQVFGTKNIMEGFKRQELEYSETPKSLSSMDSVIIPKITKDFPHINIEELKRQAENTLVECYTSVENKKVKELNKVSTKLQNNLINQIDKIKDKDISYFDFRIHRTVLHSYTNINGLCAVIFQSSLEYIKRTKKNSKKNQIRVNTEIVYVYDETDIEGEYGVSLNCHNCGAPIKNLGEKHCSYCGTGVVEFATKTWKVNDIYKK